MAGYFIANFQIDNPDLYSQYVDRVTPILGNHRFEPVILDVESQVVEGKPGNVLIGLRSESVQAARDWYDSDEYQEIIWLRFDSTSNGIAMFAEGFVRPT